MKSVSIRRISFIGGTADNPLASVLTFLCVCAVFLPYQATAVLLCVIGAAVLFLPSARKQIIFHKSLWLIVAFLLLTAVTALVYGNKKGLLYSGAFALITLIGVYIRSAMNHALFESMTNWLLVGCFLVFPACFVSKMEHLGESNYRCTLWFLNCNYLGSLLAACVIICAYKVVTKKGSKPIYYLLAAGCGICLYFTGSMFAFAEVLIGVSVLLSLTKNHQLLGAFLILCVIECVFIYCVPDLFPRLSESNITTDNRVLIWQDAIHAIPEHPLFGKGFFTFATLPDRQYITAHAHNFILEPLLSFGIVGTILLAGFFFFYYRQVVICARLLRKSNISALILAISAGVVLHATIDMTMIWTQTGLFYALIMSGLGAEEQTLNLIRKRRR